MMNATVGILEHLGQSAAHRSPSEQGCIIREVADLFMTHHASCSPSQISLFDQVMMSIVDKVDAAVRAQVAERLAPVETAPNEILRRLGGDDEIRVAGPVLSQSKCLD